MYLVGNKTIGRSFLTLRFKVEKLNHFKPKKQPIFLVFIVLAIYSFQWALISITFNQMQALFVSMCSGKQYKGKLHWIKLVSEKFIQRQCYLPVKNKEKQFVTAA